MRKTTAYARKLRAKGGPHIAIDAHDQLLNLVRPFDPGEKAGSHIKTRMAFDALRSGKGSMNDFFEVSTTMGVLFWRAAEIDASLAEIMKHGCTAMQSCWKRYQSVGKFGFAGPEISDVVAALDASEAITDASSPRQLIEAAHAAARHGQLFREALEP